MLKDKTEYNSYMNNYMKERHKTRRALVVQSLGGCCKNCGSEKDLELDHVDPTSKYKTIAKLSSASEKIYSVEVLKCQLLCRPCHLVKTRLEGSMQNKYRTCICSCGRQFDSTKSYAGHKASCK